MTPEEIKNRLDALSLNRHRRHAPHPAKQELGKIALAARMFIDRLEKQTGICSNRIAELERENAELDRSCDDCGYFWVDNRPDSDVAMCVHPDMPKDLAKLRWPYRRYSRSRATLRPPDNCPIKIARQKLAVE